MKEIYDLNFKKYLNIYKLDNIVNKCNNKYIIKQSK